MYTKVYMYHSYYCYFLNNKEFGCFYIIRKFKIQQQQNIYYLQNVNISLTAPDDYVQISEIVEFSSGLEVNATICREIIINDDQELEGNEIFIIHIVPNVPNVVLPHPYVEVLILDNDSK